MKFTGYHITRKTIMQLAINGGLPIRTRPWPFPHPVDKDDEQSLLEVLHQNNWSNGSKVKVFELEFAKFCNCSYALTAVNATAALKISLLAAGIGPGDEVIVPGMTWPSMIIAIIECGAIPVPVDIEIDSYGLDLNCVKQSITKHTKAIMPTHLFCSQTDMLALLKIADSNNLFVIEDATHVIGSERFGKKLGTFSNVGIFSFNQKKLLSCGEGGCLVTNDKNLYESAKKYQEIRLDLNYKLDGLPGTYKISEFQAAILLSQLKKLPVRLKEIEKQANHLCEKLKDIKNILPLKRLPCTDLQSFYNFCFRIIAFNDIRRFRIALAKELNLPVSGAYLPLSELNIFNVNNKICSDSIKTILRKQLNNCLKANKESVRFPHYALANDDNSVDDIFNGILKVLNCLRD